MKEVKWIWNGAFTYWNSLLYLEKVAFKERSKGKETQREYEKMGVVDGRLLIWKPYPK